MVNTPKRINPNLSLKKQGLTPAKINMLLFFIVFALEMIGGIYRGYCNGLIMNDAFSRTANAYYVLFIKPPRLASIGLVWNPLPSILQLPFAAIAAFWKPMVTKGIAAAIVTSSFAASSSVILYKAFTKLDVSKVQSLILITLYATNPFIFFYGFNGMSEMVFFFLIIYIVICMTLWIEEGIQNYITKIGFALALAFFTRYEAVPFAFAVGIGVFLIIFYNKKEKDFIPTGVKEKYYFTEGTLTVLYAPFLYSIILWVLFNWIISGNPFYFLNSSYSNLAQSQYATNSGSPLALLIYVITMSLPFIPLFIGIIIIRLSSKRLIRSDFLVLFSLVIAMLVFHYLMLVKGTSYGWLRFFSYSLPICFAWIPYELSQCNKTNINKNLAFTILTISLLVSSLLTANALNSPRLSPEEHGTNSIMSTESLQVADYINANLDGEKILTDSFLTAGIILNVNNVDDIITSASLHFYDAVNNPRKYGITYVLVPDSSGIGALDAIAIRYPYLYNNGTDWCTEAQAFDGYKLFKVIY